MYWDLVSENKLLVFLAPFVVGAFLFFLLVPLWVIFGLIALYFGILFLIGLRKRNDTSDDMKKAWEYVVKWWYDFRREDLSTIYGKGFHRYFGDDKFIAFNINRGTLSGKRAFLPLIIVVKTNPFEIVDWDDKPSYEKLKNPFLDISPKFVGSPSPTIKPEIEPMLRGRPLKKKFEDEEEKEESEVIENE